MKEFLRFEEDKLILPIILLVITGIVLLNSFQMGEVYDNSMCDFSKNVKTIMVSSQTGDLESYNRAILNLKKFDPMNEQIQYLRSFEFLHKAVKDMNPLFPVSCEISQYNYPLYDCSYYMKKETYECIKQNQMNISYLSDYSIRDSIYREPEAYIILASGIILFLEGYLISCAIIYIYRKSKNEKKVRKRRRK
jgi:hypothetical protein